MSLQELLRRQIRSSMLVLTASIALGAGVLSCLVDAWHARGELILVESFVSQTTKNSLVLDQPILLQRSATEFWNAFARESSAITGFDIYLDQAWVAQVGAPGKMSIRFDVRLEPVAGRNLRVAILISVVPIVVRAAILILMMALVAWVVYVWRWRQARLRLQVLTRPIENEIERLERLMESAHATIPAQLPITSSLQIQEVCQLSATYTKLVGKMADLERLQRMEAVTEAQRLLAAQVAHDIRSPLGFLSLLVQRPEEIAAHLDGIKTSIERLNSIADDLLVRFREEKDTRPIREIFNVGQLIQNVISEKPQEIVFKIHMEGFGLAVGDRASFQRALSNFINNACDAMNGRGQIDISMREDSGRLRIAIRDQGPGMSSETLSRLGEAGFTAGKGERGTGLGVYQATNAIRTYGGNVRFLSEVGSGTEVQIELDSPQGLELN